MNTPWRVLKTVIKTVLPLALIAVGLFGLKTLVASRPAPRKEAPAHLGALVDVIEVHAEDRRIQVKATGTVQTHREVNITPQVSGRITTLNPAFIAGGFFKKGDLLFEIERIDYELALEQARGTRARAELELARQESNARIARREWERFNAESGEEPNPLVLYEPQLKEARAALAMSDTAIRKAEVDLERTSVFAPFNGRVRTEQVEPGQYVRAGMSVATVAGSDSAEIVVPLSLEDLGNLKVPFSGSGEAGSPAVIEVSAGSRTFTWKGEVVRSLGEVDPQGRMTRIVVKVDDPYHLSTARPGGRPNLEVGMFVDVKFQGSTLVGVFPIPRRILRENSTVWIADEESRLQIRPVTILLREDETLLVGAGLNDGDRLIVTTVAGASEGMELRITAEEKAQ